MNTLGGFCSNVILWRHLPVQKLCKKARAAVSGQQALAAGSAMPASLQTWAISSEEDSGGTLSPMDGGDDRDDHAVASADDAASLQPVRINLVPAASIASVLTRILYRVGRALSYLAIYQQSRHRTCGRIIPTWMYKIRCIASSFQLTARLARQRNQICVFQSSHGVHALL